MYGTILQGSIVITYTRSIQNLDLQSMCSKGEVCGSLLTNVLRILLMELSLLPAGSLAIIMKKIQFSKLFISALPRK